MANEPQGRVTRPDEMRPPMRPDPRSESLIRAEARSRELRAQPKTGLPSDIMNLTEALAPEGWEYQAKRIEVYGKPDKQNILGNAAAGWEAVPPDRHPTVYIPPDNMLMEKPKSLVDEARKDLKKKTDAELRSQRRMLQEAPIENTPTEGARRAFKYDEDWKAVRPNRVEE